MKKRIVSLFLCLVLILTAMTNSISLYNKRFFVCYMAASVQYITDIAYNLYYNPSENISLYERVNEEMYKNLGENNPRIWHVTFAAPNSSVLTATDEEKVALCEEMIADLNTMYNLLKSEENKGGLLCYSYDKPAFEGQYGIMQINNMTNGAFNEFIVRANEIGREICSGMLEN